MGDFSDAAGEREMALKCGSLPRDAGDLAGLLYIFGIVSCGGLRSWDRPLMHITDID